MNTYFDRPVSSLRVLSAALALLFVVIAAPCASAQQLTGRVLAAGEPVAGARVELHRVTPDTSGVVAATTSSQTGAFTFRMPPTAPAEPGDFTVFFATAEHQSVRYFGPPLHGGEEPAEYQITAYDTTSAETMANEIRTVRRDIVLIPQTDGGWEVNEIIGIANGRDKTLVPRAGMPTWSMEIPDAAEDFQAGDGSRSLGEIVRVGNQVSLIDPILPGSRELFVRYRLPGDATRTELQLLNATDTLHVFVRQPSPRISVDGLATTDVVSVENERFLQFGAADVAAGHEVVLEWEGAVAAPVSPITAAVVLSALLLGGGAVAAFRSRAG